MVFINLGLVVQSIVSRGFLNFLMHTKSSTLIFLLKNVWNFCIAKVPHSFSAKMIVFLHTVPAV